MKVSRWVRGVMSVCLMLAVCQAYAGVIDLSGGQISYIVEGGSKTLPQTSYDWWYGCSATSAGMMMGYYDRNGYAGKTYGNLVPGGVAEAETFSFSTSGTAWSALVNNAIASQGHVTDFYGSHFNGGGGTKDDGYGASGDDLPSSTPWHSFNCLADFMGTSQDAYGNVNGGTTFYFSSNGAKWYPADDLFWGVQDRDGMYGIGEYIHYCHYDYADDALYTQATDNLGLAYGFTFENYKAEIDARRPVIIHVEGHSMFGYGYDDASNTVILENTWFLGPQTMTWGGSYYGMEMVAVTVLGGLEGGAPVPEPATILVWSGLGGIGAVIAYRRKRRAA